MSSTASAPPPVPSIESTDASYCPKRRRLEIIEREHAEHPFTVLPFRLVLDILKEFYLLWIRLAKTNPKMTKDIDYEILRPMVSQQDLDEFHRRYASKFDKACDFVSKTVTELPLVDCFRVLYSSPERREFEGTFEGVFPRTWRYRLMGELELLSQPTFCQSDWFGFFKLDRCRTIFQIFASVYVVDDGIAHKIPVSVPGGNPRMVFPRPHSRLRFYFPVSLRYICYSEVFYEEIDVNDYIMPFLASLCQDPIRGLKTLCLYGNVVGYSVSDVPFLLSTCPSLRRIDLVGLNGDLFLRPGFSATDLLNGVDTFGDGDDVPLYKAVAKLNKQCQVHCTGLWKDDFLSSDGDLCSDGDVCSDEELLICRRGIVSLLSAINPEGEWSDARVSVGSV